MFKNKEAYNEYMRQYMLNRYHTRRTYYLNLFGNSCNNCGSSDRLEFDHIEPDKKLFDFGSAFAGMADAKLERELKKAQLLCFKCHQTKSIVDHGHQPWIHGTLSGYRYCKCEECRMAKARYAHERKIQQQIENGEISVTYYNL